MNAIISQTFDTTASIARGAMLVDLSFSQWTGQCMNRSASDELTETKNARSKRAARVYNDLLGDCKELDLLKKYVSAVRRKHMSLTLPWADSGTRLMPTAMYEKYDEFITEARDEFERLVTVFLNNYDAQISKAAFDLGDLFDRDMYPLREQVAEKFGMSVTFSPVPLSGDFRVDIDSRIKQEMVAQYDKAMQSRMATASQDVWERLHEHLTRMVDRLGIDTDGKANIFKDTLVTGAQELIELMQGLNVTNDPDMERARMALVDAINGKSPDQLRKDFTTREATKQKVQKILDDFDFGL